MMKFLKRTACALFILLATLTLGVRGGRSQSPNQAGLVIEFGDGSLVTACIDFEGENISGYDLLARSGLSLETAFDPSQGVAVCKIGSEGCPADDCFCQMPEYWSYWNLGGGGWNYAGSGASTNRLSHGDVDGWSWGAGDPPPVMAFNQLCAPPPPPAPTETPEPQPSDTPEPEPAPSVTPKPQPSDTLEPEPTPSVTFIPPTYTKVPSSTPQPDTPTPSPTARGPSPTSTIETKTLQAAQQDGEPTSSPTAPSKEAGNIGNPAPTRTEIQPTTPTAEAEQNVDRNNSGLVGYAVFGALLIGLGMALTRIILKGRKP